MSYEKKFDRDAILTNPSLPEVYRKLVDLAGDFAVLGAVDTTKDLVSLLLRDTTSDWQREQLRHFEPFFAAANEWPDEIPEEERIEARAEKAAAKHDLDTEDSDVKQDEKGQLKEQLKRVEDADANSDDRMSGSSIADAFYLAVRLASRQTSDMEKIRNDSRVQQVANLAAERLYTDGVISFLAGRHELCAILSTGILAEKVPVDTDKLKNLGKEVIETFAERFTGGRKPHKAESKPMKELLLELERNTKAKSKEFWVEMDKPGPETLFMLPPATDEQISNLEKKLKLTLPEDYKEFLKISNGFGGTWNGYHPDPPLHGVDDVDWVFEGLEICYLELHEPLSGCNELRVPGEELEWPSSGVTVEIGREDTLSVLLVTPENTKKILEAYKKAMEGSETPEEAKKQNMKVIEARYGSFEQMQKLEWATMEFHDSESLPCGTFRQFLQDRLRRSMGGPYPEELKKEAGSIAYSCMAESS
ncbi:hypothetical protein HG530_014957 [Fusarium avenaceum]|nr:hypothetical protein DER45DRAFT_576852 [Fusarium avenaceum]KAI6749543.1 hypothetical protein HG530_014957 [Fusarium avenaceum]